MTENYRVIDLLVTIIILAVKYRVSEQNLIITIWSGNAELRKKQLYMTAVILSQLDMTNFSLWHKLTEVQTMMSPTVYLQLEYNHTRTEKTQQIFSNLMQN